MRCAPPQGWHVCTSFLLLSILLASCGGGGGGSSTLRLGPEPDINAIRTLTRTAPPTETAENIFSRQAEIFSRIDSLSFSSVYGKTSLPQAPNFTFQPSCSGIVCNFVERTYGLRVTYNLSNLRYFSSTLNNEIIGTKNQITLARTTGSYEAVNFPNDINIRSYGTWLNHSAFGVSIEAGLYSDSSTSYDFDAVYGSSGGDLTGSRPLGNATWQGIMVGSPVSGADRGNMLQGDASLTYRINDQSLDASFTNIQNIDRLASHSVSTVRFTNIPVDGRGQFRSGFTGNQIQGGFYGPNHVETVGTFEQSDIVGSFGAKKR